MTRITTHLWIQRDPRVQGSDLCAHISANLTIYGGRYILRDFKSDLILLRVEQDRAEEALVDAARAYYSLPDEALIDFPRT